MWVSLVFWGPWNLNINMVGFHSSFAFGENFVNCWPNWGNGRLGTDQLCRRRPALPMGLNALLGIELSALLYICYGRSGYYST